MIDTPLPLPPSHPQHNPDPYFAKKEKKKPSNACFASSVCFECYKPFALHCMCTYLLSFFSSDRKRVERKRYIEIISYTWTYVERKAVWRSFLSLLFSSFFFSIFFFCLLKQKTSPTNPGLITTRDKWEREKKEEKKPLTVPQSRPRQSDHHHVQ